MLPEDVRPGEGVEEEGQLAGGRRAKDTVDRTGANIPNCLFFIHYIYYGCFGEGPGLHEAPGLATAAAHSTATVNAQRMLRKETLEISHEQSSFVGNNFSCSLTRPRLSDIRKLITETIFGYY